jgi:hypothetical protein
MGWLEFVSPLVQLRPLVSSLSHALIGCAPWKKIVNDCIGRGDLSFLVKTMYLFHLEASHLPQISSPRKHIWNNDGLPKINLFY